MKNSSINNFLLNQEKIKNNNLIISPKARIIYPQNLIIGKNVKIDDGVILICKKKMKIGSYVHIAPYSVIRAHKKVTIGDYSMISSFVDIFTVSDNVDDENCSHPILKLPSAAPHSTEIHIKKYSFIGSHSVILPGSFVSEGSSIGSMTLLNFKTKAWTKYQGNPPKVIGERNKKKIKKLFEKATK